MTEGELWTAFAGAGERWAERPALRDAGATLTHGEVHARVARVAAAFRAAGVVAGRRVVLLADGRSIDHSLLLLGALRAGAVVEPAAAAGAAPEGGLVVSVRDDGATLLAGYDGDAGPGPGPDDPALVLTTTGTMGRPRRVLLSHRALRTRVTSLLDLLEPDDERVWVARTPVGSVDAIRELFGALATGGLLAFPPPGLDVEGEARFWAGAGVSTVISVPSVARAVVAAGAPLDGLRDWVLTGEPLPAGVVAGLAAAAPSCRLYDVYGCTEAPGTGARVVPGDRRPGGTALPGVTISLRGDELCLGGAGVADGYDGDPRATAAAFVPDETVPGARRFASGDLAVRDGDRIRVVGRRDRRVKLLGTAVDLDDVESVLRDAPGVTEAVVEPRGDELLTAVETWVVAHPDRSAVVGPHTRAVLTGGLAMLTTDPAEAQFMYDDLVRRRVYLRDLVHVPDGAVVVDLGANIGMFSVQCHYEATGVTVYSVEPGERTFDALTGNCDFHGVRGERLRVAVGAADGEATFVYYDEFPFLSGIRPDRGDEVALIASYLRASEPEATAELDEDEMLDLIGTRLASRTYRVPVRTVSSLLRELGLDRVDVLKVNVVKSELDVLAGIEPADFARIRQLVMEMHDGDGQVAAVLERLRAVGYTAAAFKNEALDAAGDLFHVIATREPVPAGTSTAAPRPFHPIVADDVTRWLQDRMGRHVVASPVHVVAELPRTAFGKVDRQELRRLGAPVARPVRPPRDDVEARLAEICAGLLGRPVSVDDDFFGVGGDSLRAATLVARVRHELGVELPISAMFNARTVAGLRELVRDAVPYLEPAAGDGTTGLSNEQQRLWLLDQVTPGSTAHTVSAVAELSPALTAGAVAALVEAVARRHPMLGSRLAMSADGSPSLVVGEVAVERADVADAAALDARIAAFGRTPIEPVAGAALSRVHHVRCPGRAVLLVALHHVVGDAESFRLLRRDLLAAAAGNPPPARTDLPCVRRDRTVPPATVDALVEALHDVESPLVLSARGSGDRTSLESRRTVVPLTADDLARLDGRAAELSATSFSLLLAAMTVVLSRHAAASAFAIAAPVGHRDDRDVADEVGFYSNTTAVRCDIRAGDTIRSLVERTSASAWRSVDARDVPFDTLVRRTGAARVLGVSPLAQVLLAVDVPATRLPGDGPVGPFVSLDRGMATFDLVVFFEREASRLLVDARVAVIAPDEARVLAEHLGVTLAALCTADADRLVSDVDIASADERATVRQWADSGPALPPPPLANRITDALASGGTRAAVVSGSRTWTWDELVSNTELVRDVLRGDGLVPGDRVAVFNDHPLATVAAVAACYLDGYAFMPVDPLAPPERIELMLSRAHCARVVRGDVLPDGPVPPRRLRPPAEVPDTAPSYVIFTSGSTGEPKGVALSRAGLARLMCWIGDDIGVTSESRVLQGAAFGFDVWQVNAFLALVAGATLTMTTSDDVLFGADIARLLNDGEITHASLSTSAFETVRPEAVHVPGLTVLVGGSVCSTELADRWRGRATFHNIYGPAETTLFSTIKDCTEPGQPTVGVACPGEAIQIRDPRGGLCAVGVPGDLYIGGAGVGIGYLDRPRPTAERFQPDPFTDRPGARAYDTGDRGYYLPDGEIQFLGRTDRQRKVRGYRLDLDELVALVASFDGIEAVAVDLRPGEVLTCCVGTADPAIDAETIRAGIAVRVPRWAVPTHIKVVDRIPLNRNGKPDWAAIDRIPLAVTPGTEEAPVLVLNGAAAAVADAWAATLGHRTFGPRDNFFDVGGHSLLLPALQEGLADRVGTVALVDLFRYPTVEALAEHLTSTPARAGTGETGPDARVTRMARLRGARAAVAPGGRDRDG